ncbi:MAG: hypothetical protein HZB16_05135 [Armatimonadetes bacterium]|nr:hypothetical protein [Armatimonadota bacterium]
MATITVDQHLYANVPRGIESGRGPGYQTFACGKDVATSLEYRELEQLICYHPALQAGVTPPLRETFVKLASGRFAVGRTGVIGVSPDGHASHLTRHLIFDADALDLVNSDAFLLLDEIPLPHGAQLSDPKALPPQQLKVTPTAAPFEALKALPEQLLNDLVLSVVEGTKKPILLIAGAKQQRSIMRALYYMVAADDRPAMTFDTHFVQADALRDRYRLMAVPSHAQAPKKLGDYVVFELEPDPSRPPMETQPRVAETAYGGFVLSCLAAGNWPLLNRYQMLLTTARRGIEMPLGHGDAEMLDILWTQAADAVTNSLSGHADRINSVLPHLASRNAMAHALLGSGTPSQLMGAGESGTICGALMALRDCLPPKIWLAWGERHANDPLWRKDAQIAALKPRASFWKKLTGG